MEVFVGCFFGQFFVFCQCFFFFFLVVVLYFFSFSIWWECMWGLLVSIECCFTLVLVQCLQLPDRVIASSLIKLSLSALT